MRWTVRQFNAPLGGSGGGLINGLISGVAREFCAS